MSEETRQKLLSGLAAHFQTSIVFCSALDVVEAGIWEVWHCKMPDQGRNVIVQVLKRPLPNGKVRLLAQRMGIRAIVEVAVDISLEGS